MTHIHIPHHFRGSSNLKWIYVLEFLSICTNVVKVNAENHSSIPVLHFLHEFFYPVTIDGHRNPDSSNVSTERELFAGIISRCNS